MKDSSNRGGFTLVELLVVIAIIGVLVGLTMPAVQALRETARRGQCANNLMRISMGLSEYHLSFGTLPAGVVRESGPVPNRPEGYNHNWIAAILPYLDAMSLYNAIDPAVSVYADENREARRVMLPVLRCPSAPDEDVPTTHYAGVHDPLETPIDTDNLGVFILNRPIADHDLKDGRSVTLFVGEKLSGGEDELGWMSGTRASLRNTGHPLGGIYRNASPEDPPADAPELWVGGFGSAHPGGAHFLYGDGRIELLAATADLEVLQQLANRESRGLPLGTTPRVDPLERFAPRRPAAAEPQERAVDNGAGEETALDEEEAR